VPTAITAAAVPRAATVDRAATAALRGRRPAGTWPAQGGTAPAVEMAVTAARRRRPASPRAPEMLALTTGEGETCRAVATGGTAALPGMGAT